LISNNFTSVNATDKEGQTPLHIAAFYGYIDVAMFLLDSGALLEAMDKNRKTPLCTAVWEGRGDITKFFLERNADVEVKNILQSTPLLLAAWRGHEDIVRYLLEHNADIEARNYYQETALIRAATSSRTHIVKLLLQHNASSSVVDVEGRSALHKAAIVEVAQLLLEANPQLINLQDLKGFTPLHSVVFQNQLDLVKLYIKYGADLMQKDKVGRTPIDIAQESFKDPHSEIITLLEQKTL